MKKNFFILLINFYVFSFSQTVLLDENFESYQDFTINNIGNWQTLDLDLLNTWTFGDDPAPPTNWVANWPNANAKMAYQIFNPSQANVSNDPTGVTGEMRNFDPHSGNKYAACWAGQMVASGQGNNDWLISPAVTLGSSGNQLSLWVKTMSLSYGNERYRIGVYFGSGTPVSANDFTIISSPTTYSFAPANWTQINLSLNAFSGQKIRVGVQCVTQDGSMLMIDDFKITTTATLGISESSKNDTFCTAYPNPTNSKIFVDSTKKIRNIDVYSIDGKYLSQTTQKEIDLSKYPAGNYLLTVRYEDNSSETKKILKQ